jgi:hypothetical protein
MWGNSYFSWVGSKFTEGVVQRKKGEICLAFLECLFYNNTEKICWEIGTFHGMAPSLLREGCE